MASLSGGSIRPYPTTDIGLDSELNEIIITNTDLQNNNFFKVKTKDLIKFSLNNENYKFEIKEIDKKENIVLIGYNEKITISLKIPSSKKLNLNLNENYELQISTKYSETNELEIAFKSINEKMGVVESIDSKIENTFIEFEKTYNFQLKIIMWLLAIMIFLILIYLIKAMIIPDIKLKRKKDSEKPSEVLEYLLSEIEKLKENNEKNKLKKLCARAKNLYKYLSKDEKQRFRPKIKLIETYIK